MILRIEDLHVTYKTVYGPLSALNGVDLSVEKGESVAVVGESGSVKSTLGLSIMRLLPSNAVYDSGRILFEGQDVIKMSQNQAIGFRGTGAFMIYQDPLNSLNPVKRISVQMLEALKIRYRREGRSFDEEEARKEVIEKMRNVRLPDPELLVERYPHQLSGGQIQRVVIAMGLLLRPKLMIADEPTSALDVTIQAQVLTLMNELKAEYGMSILFVTHDISIAYTMADRFLVMYAAEVCELGSANKTTQEPLHPYSQALIASIPTVSRDEGRLATIAGSPPNMIRPPLGCRFHPRCPHAMDVCRTKSPGFSEKDDRLLRCWLYG